jgi:putative oxidoreductase
MSTPATIPLTQPMNGNPILRMAMAVYGLAIKVGTWFQPVFLLIIRLYWGWQFFITGRGKLEDIGKVTNFFQSLGIPFPHLNAYLAGCTECVGGLILLVGLGCRFSTLPLIFMMIIAYLTAMPDVVRNIFSKPDDFVTADPFLFLLTAVIVFLFGPGPLSLDGLIGYVLKKRAATVTAPVAEKSAA